MRTLFAAGPFAALLLVGCPPPEEPLEPLSIEEGCQPLLAGADCMLPYPSDFFMVDDESMPSGQRVEITNAAKPVTDEGYSADVADYFAIDGFSTTQPIVALMPFTVDPEELVGIFDDYDASTTPTSTTLLLEADSGDPVAHFADVDPRATDPARQALVLNPQVGLKPETTYVVVVQGLTDAGAPGAAPEGFRRLRDGRTTQDPSLDALVPHFDSVVWPTLDAAGVQRAGVQLAWSFRTGSDERAVGDMLRVRERCLAALDETPPVVEVESFLDHEADDEPSIYRTVFAALRGPRFVDDDYAGAELARDDDGLVIQNGTTRFDLRILVPRSVAGRFEKGQALAYGHGFFGSGDGESGDDDLRRLLDEAGAVGLFIDWIGMADADVGEVVSTVGGEVWLGLRFGDRVHQAMCNYLTLTRALETGLLDAEGMRRSEDLDSPDVQANPDDASETNAGEPFYDENNVAYFGISNGHILGGVLAALHPSWDRFALHVGGASFGQMMYRALPFGRFLVVLDLRVPDPLEQRKLAAQFQPVFDRFDPARFAPYVLNEDFSAGPVANRANRSVLMSVGIGDTSVPNFASFLHARLLGIPLLTPSPSEPWGLPTVTEADAPASALTIFDVGVDDGFYATAQPPEAEDETRVHDSVRRLDEPRAQILRFLADGTIVHPCADACRLTLP